VKVLAVRLGTKGWGWQSWGVGNSEGAGVKRFARDGRKGSSLLFGLSKRTHRAKSDPYFKICKLNLNQLHYRPE
jgi:hypothetical protein